MSDKFKVDTLLVAFSIIENELPSLIGDSTWASISEEFKSELNLLRNSANEQIQNKSCIKLADLVAESEPARNRLASLINSLDLRSNVLVNITSIAKQIECPSTEIWELQREIELPSSTKTVTMKPDFSKARTVKFANFDFNFGDVTEIAAGIIALLNTIFTEKNHLLGASAILLITRGLHKAMTIDIAEQDASVLWGIIQGSGDSEMVEEDRILSITNKERKRIRLEPVTHNQVKHSLQKLSVLGIIKLVETRKNTWQIIEKVKLDN